MKKLVFGIFTTALIVLLSSCSESTLTDQGSGRLVIKVTDAPFPIDMIETAEVTITKVELKKEGDGISDGNPFIIVSDDTMSFNLVELRNGISEELANIEIPAGKYDMIRLYVEEASMKVKDGDEYTVKVPSGKQTGIKILINPGLEVDGGLTSEVLLDFDLSRSFVMRGNIYKPQGFNGFIFKPVIRAVNDTKAGRIEGMVTDTADIKLENAEVWIRQDTTVATTFTDTEGFYALVGVPAGTYTLLATKEDFDTVMFEDVKITAGNRLVKDFELTPVEE